MGTFFLESASLKKKEKKGNEKDNTLKNYCRENTLKDNTENEFKYSRCKRNHDKRPTRTPRVNKYT